MKRTIDPWKYPRWIEFVDSLRKIATGILQRYLLRDMELRSNSGAVDFRAI
jgi:acyl-coenzyme A synthetase/AMP-(fatty) acid ligase